ncbi:hypothetical protein [Natrialbaceae archaeon AArc-T1-2]|uniref:hypothetical protein n=1 Tax=Natrialbaceae archaeon AArc-T1-2 TaxID=3053904 RepID=UPI00255A8299|nr:hypothetical protein [Natrialbaceae archaeon AArc-T1-2]WIV68819.1 hypothetical protein QQ977_16055 [Natrialbaceae archaeon AArc-T1-2]
MTNHDPDAQSRKTTACPVCGTDDTTLEHPDTTDDVFVWKCTACDPLVEEHPDSDELVAPPESRLRAGGLLLLLEIPVGTARLDPSGIRFGKLQSQSKRGMGNVNGYGRHSPIPNITLPV